MFKILLMFFKVLNSTTTSKRGKIKRVSAGRGQVVASAQAADSRTQGPYFPTGGFKPLIKSLFSTRFLCLCSH